MDDSHPPDLPRPLVLREVPGDMRLYVPRPEGWQAHVKDDGLREYCYFKAPGQDWFHLLMPGEIYLQYGEARFCLNCAMRYGHLTNDRLYWQNGPRPPRSR